jgi:hypothetical protein
MKLQAQKFAPTQTTEELLPSLVPFSSTSSTPSTTSVSPTVSEIDNMLDNSTTPELGDDFLTWKDSPVKIWNDLTAAGNFYKGVASQEIDYNENGSFGDNLVSFANNIIGGIYRLPQIPYHLAAAFTDPIADEFANRVRENSLDTKENIFNEGDDEYNPHMGVGLKILENYYDIAKNMVDYAVSAFGALGTDIYLNQDITLGELRKFIYKDPVGFALTMSPIAKGMKAAARDYGIPANQYLKELVEKVNEHTNGELFKQVEKMDEKIGQGITSFKKSLASDEKGWVLELEGKEFLGNEEGSILNPFAKKATEVGEKPIISKEAQEFKDVLDKNEQTYREERAKKLSDYWKDFRRNWLDNTGNLKSDLIKTAGFLGKNVADRIILTRGASVYAKELLKEARAEDIFRGLSETEVSQLGQIAFARNIISIEEFSRQQYENTVQSVFRKMTNEEKITESERKRLIEGKRKVDHLGGLTEEKAIKFLDEFKDIHELTKERFDILQERAKMYSDAMRNIIDIGEQRGLLSKKSAQNLHRVTAYSPREWLDAIDPMRQNWGAKDFINVRDSGFHFLEGEVKSFLELDPRILLLNTYVRLASRILRNDAVLELNKLAEESLMGIERVKVTKMDKNGQPIWQPAPHGKSVLQGFEAGKEFRLFAPYDFVQDFVTSDSAITREVARIATLVSGSRILKSFATGAFNPLFFLYNFPRDLFHIFLTTNQYSSHLPVATLQMGKDFFSVIGDAWRMSGKTSEAFKEGMGLDLLTAEGMFGANKEIRLAEKRSSLQERNPEVIKGLEVLQNWATKMNITSELTGRLMIRERAIKNGMESWQASALARDYIDFGQFGVTGQVVNKIFPYFNASIQGTRGLLRNWKEKPLETTYKMAQLIFIDQSLNLTHRTLFPQSYEDTSDITFDNFFVIPTGISWKDKDNITRWLSLKIPKDPAQKFFSAFIRRAIDQHAGWEPDWGSLTQTAQDFVAIVPSTLMPPIPSALIGYLTNTDFYRLQKAWKGKEVEAYEEFNISKENALKGTNPLFIQFGKMTADVSQKLIGSTKLGVSPERIRYSLSQVFTGNNVFVNIGNIAVSELLRKTHPELFPHSDPNLSMAERLHSEIKNNFWEFIKEIPGGDKFVHISTPGVKLKNKFDETERASATERKSLDDVLMLLCWGKHSENDIIEWITSKGQATETFFNENGEVVEYPENPENLVSSLTNKYLRFRQWDEVARHTTNIPRTIWERLARATPEARAEMLYELVKREARFTKEPFEQTKDRLLETASLLSGFITDPFVVEWQKTLDKRANKQLLNLK